MGTALNLKPATASKRYSRLLAKYKQTVPGSDDQAAPVAPVAPVGQSPTAQASASEDTNKNADKKRNATSKEEFDTNEESPAKKRKTKADAPVAQVKQEAQDDVAIPSTDGPSDFVYEKRKTRGKKIDFRRYVVEVSDDEESDRTASEGYASTQSDDDDDQIMSDSDFESKPVARVSQSVTSRSSEKSAGNVGTARTAPFGTPVGLSGAQMWQTGAVSVQRAGKSSMSPPPVQLDDLTTTAHITAAGYTPVAEDGYRRRSTSEAQTAPDVQLQLELDTASTEESLSEEAQSEGAVPSIEVEEQKGKVNQRDCFRRC